MVLATLSVSNIYTTINGQETAYSPPAGLLILDNNSAIINNAKIIITQIA